VDDLMELTRLTRGTFDLRMERVDLATVVQNAIEMNHGLLQAAGHRLTVSLPVETLWLEADAIRLGQILGNLLNNACKYTPPGGSIAIAARQTDTAVTVCVRDSGMGIAPADLDRVFEMFTKAQSSALEGNAGLGIGLALSRRLAQLHGGTLTVHSDGVGKGAEFVLSLPQALQQPGVDAQLETHAADLRTRRVLVVDDNRDAADSLTMILEALGAEVRVAYAGREALDTLTHYDAGVVVLDIGMPGMDGYELAQQIRARDQGRRRLLIALTGWGQEADRIRALQAGFDHHIVKPAEISRLRTLLAGAGGSRSG
jgi:CheY-like chemotaxis protein